MITTITQGYTTSRDYDLLFELSKKYSIICVLDYSNNCRDVGHTLYSEMDGSIEISARGFCYIWAERLPHFVAQCEEWNLEWIVPQDVTVS